MEEEIDLLIMKEEKADLVTLLDNLMKAKIDHSEEEADSVEMTPKEEKAVIEAVVDSVVVRDAAEVVPDPLKPARHPPLPNESEQSLRQCLSYDFNESTLF